MSINIIRELNFDGCQRLMRELEQASPEMIKAKEKLEKISSELRTKNQNLNELLDEHEESQTLFKVEEAFDIFQEGVLNQDFVLEIILNNMEGSIQEYFKWLLMFGSDAEFYLWKINQGNFNTTVV